MTGMSERSAGKASHVFRYADGRVEQHPVEAGRKWWQLHDRAGPGPDGLSTFIKRTFYRREFVDGSGAATFEYHEETDK